MKKGDRFLLIRINSHKIFPGTKLDITKEHLDLLNKQGYVWFLKATGFLKNINLQMIEIKLNGSPNVIIRDSKENNSKSYFCEIDHFQVEDPSSGFPEYYKRLSTIKGLWMRIKKMVPIEDFNSILLNSRTLAGNTMESVLKSSATMVYFECTKDIVL